MIDFALTADAVAPQLLGCTLTHAGVSIRLTEVEAYLGAEDSAAHTFNGKTPRNAAMFGPPGRFYVYISYGIHRNVNIVCAPDGTGQGCLLRGGEIIEGADIAFARRGPHSTVLVATLDLERVKRHRAAFGFFRDRRPELYGRLVQDI